MQAVVRELSDDGGHALVMKSTVPAGTGAAIRREMPSLAYVSCPEFLKEGSAVDDFMHPDRVVIGADAGDEWAADAVEELYRPLGGEMVRTDVASAEMIKLASNAFLATKISFINEIANVCEEVGADVTEVARGMGLDKRIGPAFLQAGSASAVRASRRIDRPEAARRQQRLPLPAADLGDRGERAAEAAGDEEAGEAPRVAGRAHGRPARPRLQAEHRRHAGGLEPGACRHGLQGEGAVVRGYDPVAEARARELLPDVEFAASVAEALDGADAAILVTEWPEFAELDWASLAGRMATPLLIDGRNFLDPQALRAAGFLYEGIGRPS